MSELEQQIRDLTLRKPGEMLDRQVLSLLRSSCDDPVLETGPGRSNSSGSVNASPISEPIPVRSVGRGSAVAGFVAALLIGLVIGNRLPAFWSVHEPSIPDEPSSNTANGRVASTHEQALEIPTGHPMVPEISTRVRDALQNHATTGSQIVESSCLSAITGAAAWERQNGEIFDVRTHVSDRRFDMCRECHRAGG
ncbi:MAG: hypothetical protein KDB01_05290 [Planctomycetaceae bacterium]|nr:hypothetical protein [Planctomycetaceae bacterium]